MPSYALEIWKTQCQRLNPFPNPSCPKGIKIRKPFQREWKGKEKLDDETEARAYEEEALIQL
jgi:hypothetical protein